MSVRVISRVWDTDCPSHTSKLVLIALADNADDDGFCWPSQDTLARKCNLSKKGVILQITKLEEAGLLKVERTEGRISNRYVVLPNSEPRSPLPTVNGRVLTVNARESTVNGIPATVNAVHPNRKEPSNNHQEPSLLNIPPVEKPPKSFVKPTIQECEEFATKELKLPKSDGATFWYGKEGVGWKGVKDWKAVMRNWHGLKILASQKRRPYNEEESRFETTTKF